MPRRKTLAAIPARRWAAIRLFAMDVDGILTDSTVGIRSDRGEVKFFCVLDGIGLKRVLESKIAVAWISGRPSGATVRRAAEIKVPWVIQGRTDKLEALQELSERIGCGREHCLYMGDDDIDAPALRWAGIGVTVPAAMPAAWEAADAVTVRGGGMGAVREVCERLLASR